MANTRIPARWARHIVAATVVAPVAPLAISHGRSRVVALTHALARGRRRSAAPSSSPTCGRPSSTAIVAGTAPSARTSCSTSVAISTFCGKGIPWLMIVDSSATTPAPNAIASDTSSDIWRGSELIPAFCRTGREGREGRAGLLPGRGDARRDRRDRPRRLAADDDVAASITLRAGGQGANVAAWVAALGGRATLVGPAAPGGQGRLLSTR